MITELRERDIFLHRILGICLPDWQEESVWNGVERDTRRFCKVCGLYEYQHNLAHRYIDFSSWEGFGLLIEWLKVQPPSRIGNIIENDKMNRVYCLGLYTISPNYQSLFIHKIEPDFLADAIYLYFKDLKEN